MKELLRYFSEHWGLFFYRSDKFVKFVTDESIPRYFSKHWDRYFYRSDEFVKFVTNESIAPILFKVSMPTSAPGTNTPWLTRLSAVLRHTTTNHSLDPSRARQCAFTQYGALWLVTCNPLQLGPTSQPEVCSHPLQPPCQRLAC